MFPRKCTLAQYRLHTRALCANYDIYIYVFMYIHIYMNTYVGLQSSIQCINRYMHIRIHITCAYTYAYDPIPHILQVQSPGL